MPKKRNKLQERRSKQKKNEKVNREVHLENQRKFQIYTNEVFNEGLQLMRMNAHKKIEVNNVKEVEEAKEEAGKTTKKG